MARSEGKSLASVEIFYVWFEHEHCRTVPRGALERLGLGRSGANRYRGGLQTDDQASGCTQNDAAPVFSPNPILKRLVYMADERSKITPLQTMQAEIEHLHAELADAQHQIAEQANL